MDSPNLEVHWRHFRERFPVLLPDQLIGGVDACGDLGQILRFLFLVLRKEVAEDIEYPDGSMRRIPRCHGHTHAFLIASSLFFLAIVGTPVLWRDPVQLIEREMP